MKKNGSKKRSTVKGIIVAIVVLFALFFALTGFITDLLWFKELGYISLVNRFYQDKNETT